MAAPMDVLKFVKVDPHKNEENGMKKAWIAMFTEFQIAKHSF